MKKTYSEVEEMENTDKLYIVFEEDNAKKPKNYDLTLGIFDNLEEALQERGFQEIARKEKIYVTKYNDYISGNYDYI